MADATGVTDEQLAAAAAGGDRRALERLLDRHADRVHAVCRRVVLDAEDALDATQEALLAIARGIGRFDGRSRLSTWIHRVATNAALDELRRKRRRPLTGVADDVAVVADERGPMAAGDREQPIDAVEARLDVDTALQQVPEEFRVAVVLRDLADLDYGEIAAALDVPLGTVKSRVARGRAALRAALAEPRAEPGNPAARSDRPSEQP